MALTASIIQKKLAAASWTLRDNVAQDIINGATTAELKNLDAEGVLRLYEALGLSGGWYSSRDSSAMKRLATESQFQPVKNTPDFGVGLVKRAAPGANIQTQLSAGLVARIYAAEKKRLSVLEKVGFDGSTVGRGQLGQPAYNDVKSPRHFKAPLEECMTRVILAKALSKHARPGAVLGFDMTTYKLRVTEHYSNVWRDPVLEDFVVAAYLAIRIRAATKSGRSAKDTARFAVALYHGMRKMVVAAQNTTGDTVNWKPVEAELKSQGHTDAVAYVNEVVR